MKRTIGGVMLAAAMALTLAGTATAQEDLGVNVLVTIKVADAGKDGKPRKREYRVVLREDDPTELLVGARMPLAISVSTDS